MTAHYENDAEGVDPVELVKSRVQGVVAKGGGWDALCPMHDDKRPSLRIDRGDDGRALLTCRAGCAAADIVAALGLKMADLFPRSGRRVTGAPRPTASRPRSDRNAPEPNDDASKPPELKVKAWTWETPRSDGWRFVQAYDYQDLDGVLVLQAGRFEYDRNGIHGKTFRQRRPEPGKPGHWLGTLDDAPRPLYRAAEIAAAVRDGRRVYVPEGEKDVENLRLIGLVAGCNPMGAGLGKWRPEHTASLAGAHVVILPDNDEPGRKHAERIAEALAGVAASVRLIELPELPPKGDVSDWIAAGGTRDALDALADCAPPDDECGPGHKPEIKISQAELTRMVDAAIDALLSSDATIYSRERRIVRVLRDGGACKVLSRPPGAPIIGEAPFWWLMERVGLAADWRSLKKTKDTEGWVPAAPPKPVVSALCERGEWSFRPLEGVIEAPCMRPDGSILDQPGYDAATGLLYDPGCVAFLPVPHEPTRDDATRAIEVLKEPFRDFPFVEETDRAAAIAFLLTVIARFAIDGCVPLCPLTATVRRTGKSKLVDVISIVATGRSAPRMTQIVNDLAEERKTILALCMEGDVLILIDNCDAPLGSSELDALLTARTYKARLLGINGTKTAPNNAVWCATGNNLEYKGDLPGRIVPIRLQARVENPEERSDFAHADLLGWVRENRPQLVCAALTVLRAFHCAGRPRQALPTFGGFEEWSALIREAVVWAGIPDPLRDRKAVTEASDSSREELRTLLHAWFAAFGTSGKAVRDAIAWAVAPVERDEHAAARAALRAAIAAVDPRFEGEKVIQGTVTKLGKRLSREKGRIVDGLSFRGQPDTHTKAMIWRVDLDPTRKTEPGSAEDAEDCGSSSNPTRKEKTNGHSQNVEFGGLGEPPQSSASSARSETSATAPWTGDGEVEVLQ